MDANMPLIASTYKIINQVGSGGGGTVYLGEHLRLGKKVVLKADKRTLSAKPEVLRREVDALKNLNHSYIPQVYDFIEDNGIVYTVMDYIEGESFDKPLKRGLRFNQAQIVDWACQLLEAITYLHSRPPHGILHADIKPANIMLTPQGDVRLIDFNIALALGEEGAVAVGRSFGYASPEHYGQDYSSGNITQGIATDAATNISTDSVSYINTILETAPQPSLGSSSTSKKTIMLNVRSDIYSLGATLYHIITGVRPAQNATEVNEISSKDCSPAIISIIAKAMNPNPDLRWQSADEMLYAFKHLHENDPRTKRHKRISAIAAAMLAFLFLAGGITAFAGQSMMEQEQRRIAANLETVVEGLGEDIESLSGDIEILEDEIEELDDAERLSRARVLAGDSADALRNGDVGKAVSHALQAIDLYDPPIAEARKALTDALGIYDLTDGYKPHMSLAISGEVLKFAVSPSESLAAAKTLGLLTIFVPETGRKAAELPTIDSALADVIFLDDSTIVYAGVDGITMYDLLTHQVLWTGLPATAISVSADGSTIAAVLRDDTFATIYGTDGSIRNTISFGDRYQRIAVNDRLADPNNNIFAVNADGTLLAVSFSDGSLDIYNLTDDDGNIVLFGETDYTHFEGGFNGKYFVFSATNNAESLFVAVDVAELEQTDYFIAPERVSVTADENGIFLSYRDRRVRYNPETLEETDPEHGRVLPLYNFEHSIDSQDIKITKLESNADKEIFNYNSFYIHDEARIAGDGMTVMLFSIHGFRLFSIDGSIIADIALDDGIYDQQFKRTGGDSHLEVTWYDGTVRKYSTTDGTIISEEHVGLPDESLYEEFFTDSLRIESKLHGTPAAFDISTGELVRELERDAYLTYVTQVGGYIITEYINALDGTRFGLLLDGVTLETLAVLPHLCDVIGDRLIFNIRPGSLREMRILSTDDLIAIAR